MKDDIKTIKSKAEWLPPRLKYFKQILISIRAIFTLPFFKEEPDGIQKLFSNSYWIEKDEFIFDGSNDYLYYNQITKNISKQYFKNQVIIDFGCGNGSFYFWLRSSNIPITKYIGIDFAYKDTILSDEAEIRNVSFSKYLENPFAGNVNSVAILSNTLCYISDEIFQSILSKSVPNDKIIIIEPYPNLFWDKHFNGIKPFYRTEKQVIKLLEDNGFVVKTCSIDYAINIKNIHLNPISYCLYVVKI
jgi:hypothetical protein